MSSRLDYKFRPFTPDDLPLVQIWLQTPEVVKWWGNPDEQFALLEGDLAEPNMEQWLVCFKGKPFAYVQSYPVHIWPQAHFQGLPPKSRGVDAFIGVPEMLGKGHGSAFLRAFAQKLASEGAPCVAIDPEESNARARRAYANAGFVEIGVFEVEDERSVLMIWRETPVCEKLLTTP